MTAPAISQMSPLLIYVSLRFGSYVFPYFFILL